MSTSVRKFRALVGEAKTSSSFRPAEARKAAGDVIGWDQSNRAYIMTHGVSGVDWLHYKHPLPEHVLDVTTYWKGTNFTPSTGRSQNESSYLPFSANDALFETISGLKTSPYKSLFFRHRSTRFSLPRSARVRRQTPR